MRDEDMFIEPPDPPNTYFNPNNTLEEAQRLQAEANQYGSGSCVFCKNKFFWLPGDRAWVGGHIYSQLGAKEIRISQICEFCFDTTTLDEEENPKLFAHYKAIKEKVNR